MRSPRVGSGRISQRCVLHVSAVAKYSSKAFPGTHPWQDFRLMYAKRGLGRKNTPSVATYRRYVSKMSSFWQDLRAAYLKSPADRCLGIHIVKILPGRAPFPVRGLQIIHSANILPSCLPKPRKIASARSPAHTIFRAVGNATHFIPSQTQKGDPVGSPFNSGTDQKNQLKVIVDDPYLYRSSFSFAAS